MPLSHLPLATALKIRPLSASALLFLLFFLGSVTAHAQAPDNDSRLLDDSGPIKQKINGGEFYYYRVMARADQYLRLVVDQRGIDVRVKLYQPDGSLVAQSNRLTGAYGPETIFWVAEDPGVYKVEVRAQPDQLAGYIEVKLVEEHVATFQDRSSFAAQAIFLQAEQLREQKTPTSLDLSLAKYQEALQAWRYIGNSYGEAETLNFVGLIYDVLKRDRVNARQNYEQALQIWKSLGDRRGEAESLSNIARVYESLGEREKALDYYNRSLQPWVDAGDRYGEAWVLFNMGRVYSLLKDAPRALDHFNRALKLWRELGDVSRDASTLNGIGEVYFSLNDYTTALTTYTQARERWQAVNDLDGEASTLFAMSRIYGVLHDQNRENEFRNLATQTKEKAQQARTFLVDPAKSDRTRLAEQAREEARNLLLRPTPASRRQAIEQNEEAVRLFDSVAEYDREVFALFDISSIYRVLGDKANERKTLDRALSVTQRVGKAALRAEALQRIAEVHSVSGDQQKAVDYYDRAIEIWRRQNDRRSEAYVLALAAKAYDSINENEKAVDYLRRALKLYQDVGDRVREAYTLNDLATIHHQPEETQKTLDYLKQTRDLRRDKGDRAGEAETLKEIVAVYLSMGEKRKALEYYFQALALYQQIGDGIGQAEILRDLMAYWKGLNQPRLAIFYGKQAINTYQGVRSNILGLEKETQTSFVKSKEDIYRELADLLISEDRLPEAQQVLDMLKEEEYNNFIRGRRKKGPSANDRAEPTPKETEVYEQYVELTKLAAAQSALYDRLRQEEARDVNDPELRDLRAKFQEANARFQGYLDQLSNQISKSLQDSEALKNRVSTIKGYQGLISALEDLGPGSVVLYTLFVKDRYSVVLFTPNVKIARQYSIKKADLNGKIMALRSALEHDDVDPKPLAQDLYKILIAPIAKDLTDANARTLMWSLDGILRYVPIAVLHDGKQYMVERYRNEVFTLTSVSRLSANPQGPWRGLGFGVSKFSDGDSLPEVKTELNSIIRNEDDPKASGGSIPGKVILDDDFSKDRMTSLLLLRKYKLVHFASHFDFKTGDSNGSYLLLGKGDTLTVKELSTMSTIFKGVDLLTLSACNTATDTNSKSGEEIDNFGEIAQQQGAMAVIASLWAVDDASTRLLMEKFYQSHFKDSNPLNKADALQAAQLALLTKEIRSPSGDKDYSHPYFWAPFILIGNWK